MNILERISGSRFSRALRAWEGTAVVIGGGASLTVDQVEAVRVAKREGAVAGAIVVNDGYLIAPWADVLYGADVRWWQWQEKGYERPLVEMSAEHARFCYRSFEGQRCSIQHGDPKVGTQIEDDRVHLLRNKTYPHHSFGLSSEQEMLVTGRNSGFQALNLAILSGAKRIVLLGIDGKPGPSGRTHWFGEHPTPSSPQVYEEMRRAFSASEQSIRELGVEVINCSPGSYIDSFPKKSLEEVL